MPKVYTTRCLHHGCEELSLQSEKLGFQGFFCVVVLDNMNTDNDHVSEKLQLTTVSNTSYISYILRC